jgi:hypothetical protein
MSLLYRSKATFLQRLFSSSSLNLGHEKLHGVRNHLSIHALNEILLYHNKVKLLKKKFKKTLALAITIIIVIALQYCGAARFLMRLRLLPYSIAYHLFKD